MSMLKNHFVGLASFLGIHADTQADDIIVIDLETENSDGADGDDAGAAGGDGTGAVAGGADDDGAAGGDGNASANVSADNQTYAAGVQAERRRWAQILTSAECQKNLELATMLAVETEFTAEKIGSMCAVSPSEAVRDNEPDPVASALLATTKKPKVQTNGSAEGDEGPSAGTSARKRATANINKDRAPRAQK